VSGISVFRAVTSLLLFLGFQLYPFSPREDRGLPCRSGHLLGNIPVSAKESGDENCALSSPHLGVVRYKNIFDAIFQDVVLPDSAHLILRLI